MNLLPRLVTTCLRIAARRWPATMRDERLREWTAELPMMGPWSRLSFAWSLAWSPPIKDDRGVPGGWREFLPVLGRGVQPVLALIAMGFVCLGLAGGVPALGSWILALLRGYPSGLGPYWPNGGIDWAANAVSLAALALAAFGALWIGRWVGGRAPLRWAHRGRLSGAGSALLAPALLAVGVLLVHILSELRFREYDEHSQRVYVPHTALAIVVWAVLTTAVMVAVVRRRNWLIAVVGGLVVLDVTAIVTAFGSAGELEVSAMSAPLWFPLALLDLEGSGVRFGFIDQGLIGSEIVARNAAQTVRPLLLGTVMLIGYVLAPIRAVAVSPVALTARGAFRPVSLLWAALPAAALVLWAYGLTGITGALNAVTDPVGEHHIWAHEMRQAAIVAAVAGLALLLAGRGPVVFPAVLALVALFAVDSVFDTVDATSKDAGVLAFGIGAAVLCGAWLLSRAFRTTPAAETARRCLVGFAILTAVVAPGIATHVPSFETVLPRSFWITSGVTVGLLVALASALALAARERPLRMATPLVLALASAVGYLSTVHFFAVLAGAPLVVIVVWLTRPGPKLKRAGIMLAALVAAVPIVYVQFYGAVMFGDALMLRAGYSFPADGLPFLPGSILVGTLLAVVISAKVVPRPVAVPAAVRPVEVSG